MTLEEAIKLEINLLQELSQRLGFEADRLTVLNAVRLIQEQYPEMIRKRSCERSRG